MSDMNFICPTCKRPTHPTDNEIIEYLAKEIDRHTDVLVGRTKELDRTRKELEQSEICCTEWEKQALDYKAENIVLSGELERTRKALDVAVSQLKKTRDYIEDCRYQETNYFLVDSKDVSIIFDETNESLKKITALEQKDN